MKRINTWGGKREGAGRKKNDSVAISWRISERSRNWINEQAAQQGVNQGAIIDQLIRAFEEQCEALAKSE
jgi:hypothetical protein